MEQDNSRGGAAVQELASPIYTENNEEEYIWQAITWSGIPYCPGMDEGIEHHTDRKRTMMGGNQQSRLRC